MRLPAAILLATTTFVAPAFMAMSEHEALTTAKVNLQVVDLNDEGVIVARVTPTPLAIMVPDRPLGVGDNLTCALAGDHLDCGDVRLKPLGFVIRASDNDLKVQAPATVAERRK